MPFKLLQTAFCKRCLKVASAVQIVQSCSKLPKAVHYRLDLLSLRAAVQSCSGIRDVNKNVISASARLLSCSKLLEDVRSWLAVLRAARSCLKFEHRLKMFTAAHSCLELSLIHI
eukprot:13301024-Alexandrium_andersonii.AAC.1